MHIDWIKCLIFNNLVQCCLHSDISESRLKFAKQLGAEYTLTIEPSSDAHTNASTIAGLIGCQPDVTIECSGAESSLQTAIYVKFNFLLTFEVHLFLLKYLFKMLQFGNTNHTVQKLQ